MKEGKIKFFNTDRGFGFITADDGSEYFCHISNVSIAEGEYPEVGQLVKFSVKVTDRGPVAVLVSLVGEPNKT